MEVLSGRARPQARYVFVAEGLKSWQEVTAVERIRRAEYEVNSPSANNATELTAFAAFAPVFPVAAGARGALFSGPGDVHGQWPTLKFLVVEHFHRFRCLARRGVLDEGKPARF